MNAIEIRNMYKDFKLVYDKPTTLKERICFWKTTKVQKRQVLKNINLDIKKGETVALIGTNGSGKSTLLKLMTKILYPNKGLPAPASFRWAFARGRRRFSWRWRARSAPRRIHRGCA